MAKQVVTMDCTKCREHIEQETAKRIFEEIERVASWLSYPKIQGGGGLRLEIKDTEYQALKKKYLKE